MTTHAFYLGADTGAGRRRRRHVPLDWHAETAGARLRR